jgi:hypothetical protein
MSSTGVLGGAVARGPSGSSGRKCGRPLGRRNKVKDPAATPPVPRKRGHPPGSHKKRTLGALAAAATAESARVVPSTVVIAAPAAATAPAEAAITAGLAVTPLEAAAAIIGAVVSVGAAPPGFAGAGTGGSISGAATVVYKPRRPPVRQRLSYTSEHGFTTFVAHLRAGSEVRLPLPFRFVDTLGEHPLTRAMVVTTQKL